MLQLRRRTTQKPICFSKLRLLGLQHTTHIVGQDHKWHLHLQLTLVVVAHPASAEKRHQESTNSLQSSSFFGV